jgi:DNA-binding NarL/FixJ family response regulator
LIQTVSQGLTAGHDLTPREREVLALVVKGLSNPEIARQLFVSRSTANDHVSHISSELGASNRAQAIPMTLQQGLVS